MTHFERMREELAGWADAPGMSPSVLLQLSEPLRSALKRVMRQGSMTSTELAQELDLSLSDTEVIAGMLIDRGFLKTSQAEGTDGPVYSIRHSRTHRAEAPIALWDRLLEPEEGASDDEK